MKHRFSGALALAALALSACSAKAVPALPQQPASAPAATAVAKIRHVVIMIQENRSFDNFFATFPGADGALQGTLHSGQTVALSKHALLYPRDIVHDYHWYRADYDNAKMDGFDLEPLIGGAQPSGTYPYTYVDPAQIAPYWDMAKQYALLDHFFQTQGSASFTAHQDLIAAGTPVTPSQSIVDDPSNVPWGCTWSPAGTVTSLITSQNQYETNQGPFPCLTYRTLRDLLDAKHVSWKYYTPPFKANGGGIWNAFAAIKAVYEGPEWRTNVVHPTPAIFKDIAGGTLPSVAWVVPGADDSDHPGEPRDNGPSWVASVVNAIGRSQYWKSTAIVVVWDDWGGLYDHVPPPQLGYGGLGFRLPCLVVSAYARKGTIAHQQFEFGSIARFIEDLWHLGSLNATDVRARSIGDVLTLPAPRKFVPIAAPLGESYFLHEPPSDRPLDSE